MAAENLPLVGMLLGHRRHRTTARYAHLADAHLVEAAEKVGDYSSSHSIQCRCSEGQFPRPFMHWRTS